MLVKRRNYILALILLLNPVVIWAQTASYTQNNAINSSLPKHNTQEAYEFFLSQDGVYSQHKDAPLGSVTWNDHKGVYAINVEEDDPTNGDVVIYASGEFTLKTDSFDAENIARWSVVNHPRSSGTDTIGSWKPLPDNATNGTNGAIFSSYRFDNNTMLTAGKFDQAEGNSARIANWDEVAETWSEWGTNTTSFNGFENASDPTFFVVKKMEGDWFVGGRFEVPSGGDLFLARNTGSSNAWNGVSGIDINDHKHIDNPGVYAMEDDNGNLYFGGLFQYQDSNFTQNNLFICTDFSSGSCNSKEIWTGWPNNRVKALLKVPNGALYLGGDFTKVGSDEMISVAKKEDPTNDGSTSALLDADTGEGITAGGVVNTMTVVNVMEPDTPLG